MKIKKIFIVTLMILSFILLLFFSKETYGKYVTTTERKTTMPIARWKILVNNEDITNENVATTTINPIFEGNDNIAANIIAPTSEGYFNLLIDSNETDVSFKYKIEISVNENSAVTDLIATSYQVNGGEIIPITPENQTIENTILYVDENKLKDIKINVKWMDGANETMNNAADTKATENPNNLAILNVKLSFIQLAN